MDNDVENTIDRDHDEHTNDAIENSLAAEFSAFGAIGGDNKLHHTPQENHQSYAEHQKD